jgi:hypothetical protein
MAISVNDHQAIIEKEMANPIFSATTVRILKFTRLKPRIQGSRILLQLGVFSLGY